MARILEQLSFPFKQFEDELTNPLDGHQLSKLEAFIGSLLLDADSEKPLKTTEIVAAVFEQLGENLNRRRLKIIIRNLRRLHGFPILTRRSKPAGYFWCRSKKEWAEFEKMWMSQVMDELVTHKMMKKSVYPNLAGQRRLFERL